MNVNRDLPELIKEPWFDGDLVLPQKCNLAEVKSASESWRQIMNTVLGGMFWGITVTPALRFNRILNEAGTKAAVTSAGLIWMLNKKEHIGSIANHPDKRPVLVICDKLGGRNFYGPILQAAFPDGWPVAEKESAAESRSTAF